jgi:hypothetical protein
MRLRVSERILHVETTLLSPKRVETIAYPVHNLARVVVTPHRPDYARAALEFLIGLGVLGAFMAAASDLAADLSGFVLAVALLLAIRLVVVLATPARYALLVETSGTAFTRVVSRDEALIQTIGSQIVDAINNPQAAFQYHIEHVHIGDKIKLLGGSQNIGKVG